MDYNARATQLQALSRLDLKRAAKILKLKGYGNKNKTELIALIMEAEKQISKHQYDAEDAILKVREALGLSISGNIKSRTQGLRKNYKDSTKTAKELAADAMKSMREAMAVRDKPKLKKQFIERMRKEMDAFEKEIEEINRKQPAVAARRSANKRYKDSAELKQDL